ncbi:MAG: hypothetical protein NVSMB64_27940 [Candidatus Velthaea sp.]
MIRSFCAAVLAFALLAAAPPAKIKLDPVPHNAQTDVVTKYLQAMQSGKYDEAFALLNGDARAYYRNAANFRSIYDADGYRVQSYKLIGTRGDDRIGRVYFARETATYHDHAHGVEGTVRANVPVGVVAAAGGWRIKDPGHPWRAFAPDASASNSSLKATVKKISFFERRIEVIVTFANAGDDFVTLLPYGKSVLRDDLGGVYRIIETKDWSLTDRTLFQGLRLAPNAMYTGVLTFESGRLDDKVRTFALTIAPALREGADAPFELDIANLQPPRG